MIKKILLLTIIFFWFFLNGNVFAVDEPKFDDIKVKTTSPEPNLWDHELVAPEVSTERTRYDPSQKYDNVSTSDKPEDNMKTTKKIISEIENEISNIKKEMEWLNTDSEEYKNLKKELDSYNEDLKKEKDHYDNQLQEAIKNRINECKKEANCIDQASFDINTGDIFGGISATASATDTRTGTNMLLGTIIEKLMVALGILSVLIMTVWGGYIILYHGQDELLSKGKSIFMSWVVALVVALSSYMIVGLLRFILYNN